MNTTRAALAMRRDSCRHRSYRAGGKQYVAVTSGNTSWLPYPNTGKATLAIFGL